MNAYFVSAALRRVRPIGGMAIGIWGRRFYCKPIVGLPTAAMKILGIGLTNLKIRFASIDVIRL